ncbi:MAG: MBL fold metallo-hydrolase [Burkholderiales bacterium]
MKTKFFATLAAGCLLAGAAAAVHAADDASALLRRAELAMGGAGLQSLRFNASGTGSTFGQAFKPGFSWPMLGYSAFARTYDYGNAAMREEFARSRAEPTGGGAIPLMGMGAQRATFFLRGDTAWNQTGPNAFGPAWVAVGGRIHDLWTSPHGVLKAALRNQATVSFKSEKGRSLAAVSFTEPGRFKATAYINADYLVERVESVHPHAVLGDVALTTRYSDYRDHGGVKFPDRMIQTHGSTVVLDVVTGGVQVNAPAGIEVPASVQGAVERVTAEKVADGVWFLGGGSHNSVAIEMKDHMILVEAPLFDGRTNAVIEEVKKLGGGKPLRYVVNSHHHFDHAGGLRAAAAAGATVVVAQESKALFEKAFANPNRIRPDSLATSKRRAKVMAFNAAGKTSGSLGDASRPVEVHAIQGSVHATGFNMVWLPRERLLIQADAYTPMPPNAPAPTPPNGNNVNLAENIDRMGWKVDRLLPLHGRVVPLAELHRTIGRK